MKNLKSFKLFENESVDDIDPDSGLKIGRLVNKYLTTPYRSRHPQDPAFYSFENMPTKWVQGQGEKSYRGDFDFPYDEFIYDNFKDMDEMIGHPESLFGTRGLPVGHPKRTSRSFNDVHKKYGTAIVRVIFNQLKEELESIRGTPIYHFTTVDNALKILESNELRGTLPSDEYLNLDKRLAKTKHQMTISFTRDKNFKGDQSLAGQSKQPLDVILVLDRNKLKTRYKTYIFIPIGCKRNRMVN